MYIVRVLTKDICNIVDSAKNEVLQRYCFRPFVCLFVCLFVNNFLTTILAVE